MAKTIFVYFYCGNDGEDNFGTCRVLAFDNFLNAYKTAVDDVNYFVYERGAELVKESINDMSLQHATSAIFTLQFADGSLMELRIHPTGIYKQAYLRPTL